MNPEEILKWLNLADQVANVATAIYAHITQSTGKSLEEIRASRDALSAETHQLAASELAAVSTD